MNDTSACPKMTRKLVNLISESDGLVQDDDRFFNQFARHVNEGLSKSPKAISSLYFYDARGSEIYSRITDLEEYYLTKCEFEILKACGPTIITDHFLKHPKGNTHGFNLVELGAGDGRKTKVLLDILAEQEEECEYIPIDISEQALTDLFKKLGSCFHPPSRLKCTGIIGDHIEGLDYVRAGKANKKNVILFLGSSIGNFEKLSAIQFLKTIRAKLSPGDILMIGFDMIKDEKVVHSAYCDSKGVSRDFNLNLLTRMNRELGANFDLSKFKHRPLYNRDVGVMESYLESTEDQHVTFTKLFKDGRNKTFTFKRHERLSTEYSFKYTEETITTLARASGFTPLALYSDSRNWFIDAVWTVA